MNFVKWLLVAIAAVAILAAIVIGIPPMLSRGPNAVQPAAATQAAQPKAPLIAEVPPMHERTTPPTTNKSSSPELKYDSTKMSVQELADYVGYSPREVAQDERKVRNMVEKLSSPPMDSEEKAMRQRKHAEIQEDQAKELSRSKAILGSGWKLEVDSKEARACLLEERGSWNLPLKASNALTWRLTFTTPRKISAVKYRLYGVSSGCMWTLKFNDKPVEDGIPLDGWYTAIAVEPVESVELSFKAVSPNPNVTLAGVRLIP